MTLLAGLWRVVSPLRHGHAKPCGVADLAESLWSPRRYFMDDLLGMIAAEAVGFRRSAMSFVAGADVTARERQQHPRYLPEMHPL